LTKFIVITGVSHAWGTEVHIDGFSLGVFKPGVHIRELKVYNPKGFPKQVMIDIEAVNVHYAMSSVFSGTLHVPMIVFTLNEMIIVKDKDGSVNVDGLKVAQQ
jgi:uncharacterized protein involved in outer membrane biogenesis